MGYLHESCAVIALAVFCMWFEEAARNPITITTFAVAIIAPIMVHARLVINNRRSSSTTSGGDEMQAFRKTRKRLADAGDFLLGSLMFVGWIISLAYHNTVHREDAHIRSSLDS